MKPVHETIRNLAAPYQDQRDDDGQEQAGRLVIDLQRPDYLYSESGWRLAREELARRRVGS
jgi:hypothetical protein